jgi:hypothetical protein
MEETNRRQGRRTLLLREAGAQEILQPHRWNGNGRHIDTMLLNFVKY